MLRAVAEQFEIIGEEFTRLRNIDPTTAATIRELTRIIAVRNVLVHGYAIEDNRLVRVESALDSLRTVLEKLLAGA
jgi:uncharacterized protein with HEPN domain